MMVLYDNWLVNVALTHGVLVRVQVEPLKRTNPSAIEMTERPSVVNTGKSLRGKAAIFIAV